MNPEDKNHLSKWESFTTDLKEFVTPLSYFLLFSCLFIGFSNYLGIQLGIAVIVLLAFGVISPASLIIVMVALLLIVLYSNISIARLSEKIITIILVFVMTLLLAPIISYGNNAIYLSVLASSLTLLNLKSLSKSKAILTVLLIVGGIFFSYLGAKERKKISQKHAQTEVRNKKIRLLIDQGLGYQNWGFMMQTALFTKDSVSTQALRS